MKMSSNKHNNRDKNGRFKRNGKGNCNGGCGNNKNRKEDTVAYEINFDDDGKPIFCSSCDFANVPDRVKKHFYSILVKELESENELNNELKTENEQLRARLNNSETVRKEESDEFVKEMHRVKKMLEIANTNLDYYRRRSSAQSGAILRHCKSFRKIVGKFKTLVALSFGTGILVGAPIFAITYHLCRAN